MATFSAVILSSTDKGLRVARQPEGTEGWLAKSGISNLKTIDVASKAAQTFEIPKDKEWMLKKFERTPAQAKADAEIKKEEQKPPEERLKIPFTIADVVAASGAPLDQVEALVARKIADMQGLIKEDARWSSSRKTSAWTSTNSMPAAPKEVARLVTQAGTDNGATLHLRSAVVAESASARPVHHARAEAGTVEEPAFNRIVQCTSIEVTSPGKYLPAMLDLQRRGRRAVRGALGPRGPRAGAA